MPGNLETAGRRCIGNEFDHAAHRKLQSLRASCILRRSADSRSAASGLCPAPYGDAAPAARQLGHRGRHVEPGESPDEALAREIEEKPAGGYAASRR